MIVVLGLLGWFLVSVPFAVVVGRGIADAERRASQPSRDAPATGRSVAT